MPGHLPGTKGLYAVPAMNLVLEGRLDTVLNPLSPLVHIISFSFFGFRKVRPGYITFDDPQPTEIQHTGCKNGL